MTCTGFPGGSVDATSQVMRHADARTTIRYDIFCEPFTVDASAVQMFCPLPVTPHATAVAATLARYDSQASVVRRAAANSPNGRR